MTNKTRWLCYCEIVMKNNKYKFRLLEIRLNANKNIYCNIIGALLTK